MIDISINRNTVVIPPAGKKRFMPNIDLNDEEIKLCLDFAREMAYGKGFHAANAFASSDYIRNDGQIFRDTLQGKLAEYSQYKFLAGKGLPPDNKPDFSVWGIGKWEDTDFYYKNRNKRISVKSTKHFGNLLLLEKNRYSEIGEYLEPADGEEPVKHDIFFLTRVSGIEYYKREEYKDLKNIKCEVTGFITSSDFKQIIDLKHIIKKGSILGIPMIADNYYLCVSELRSPDQINEYI